MLYNIYIFKIIYILVGYNGIINYKWDIHRKIPGDPRSIMGYDGDIMGLQGGAPPVIFVGL